VLPHYHLHCPRQAKGQQSNGGKVQSVSVCHNDKMVISICSYFMVMVMILSCHVVTLFLPEKKKHVLDAHTANTAVVIATLPPSKPKQRVLLMVKVKVCQ